MGNKFDAEMERIKSTQVAGRSEAKTAAVDQLASLKKEIQASKGADDASLGCRIEGDGLSISVKGQPVGVWRIEGANLALYRPGSPSAESHATSASEAAKMTARLVAAAAQA